MTFQYHDGRGWHRSCQRWSSLHRMAWKSPWCTFHPSYREHWDSQNYREYGSCTSSLTHGAQDEVKLGIGMKEDDKC